LEPDEVKYSETVMYKAFNRLIEHVFPKVIKLDESSIAWHDEELLTKVETVK
jgi:predicted DNA-binding transcriptional regulator AlpA